MDQEPSNKTLERTAHGRAWAPPLSARPLARHRLGPARISEEKGKAPVARESEIG